MAGALPEPIQVSEIIATAGLFGVDPKEALAVIQPLDLKWMASQGPDQPEE